ncbi:MAG: alpha/beta hydrolase, partial [Acidimicrobiia bacterium]|nr:alpha/beta hydrolase [Acidimicrobiia bacterium]
APLVGHSMGAFVVAVAVERHPDRVEHLILVDGGLPLPVELSPDVDIEAAVQSVIGPALDRLDQRWPDEEAYVEFFTNHPAFQPPNEWPAAAEAYVRYDAVVTPEGEIRSSVNKEAVLVDGGAAIVEPESSAAIRRIATPTVLLWAPRGILDQSPGLYSREQIDEAVTELAHLEAELIDHTNHYTIVVGERGAAAVADAIDGAAD